MNQYNIKITPEEIFNFNNVENMLIIYIEILAIVAGILIIFSFDINNFSMSKYPILLLFLVEYLLM